jgi:alkylation response protein AidB-like acyl-CoA dehydrogenase
MPSLSSTATPVHSPTAPLPLPDLDALPSVVAGLAARAGDHDRDASFPHEGVAAVHAAGLLTASVGTDFGGPALGVRDCARLLARLGSGDPSVALVTCMTLLVHAAQANRPTWPAEVYREVLAESADRPVLINALRVEPELGSPTRGGLPATVARRTGDDWALSGRKIYSTGSVGLRWMAVWARTDEQTPRVGAFLVRADRPGIRIEPTWDHLGLRASASHDVEFTDVAVDADAHTELTAPGTPTPPTPAQQAWQLTLPAIYLGVARSALEWLVGFLHDRVPSGLGAPLATVPRFQAAVGEIEARIVGAEEALFGLAGRIDAGDPDAYRRAGAAKLVSTRAAIEAVEQAVALVGNPGLTRHNPLQRHYRDVLCGRVHTPQDDTIVSTLGRTVLAAGRP